MTQVSGERGVRSWAVCQGPSSMRTSTLEMPRRSGVGDPADGDQGAMVGVDDGHVDGNRVDDRRRLHAGGPVPAAHDPVAGLPVVGDFDGLDPLGLFHAVDIGDVDAGGSRVRW